MFPVGLSRALNEAMQEELSACQAEFSDCNIEVTENDEILIPGCGAENYPHRARWERVVEVPEGKIIELNIQDLHVRTCLHNVIPQHSTHKDSLVIPFIDFIATQFYQNYVLKAYFAT